MYIPKEFNNSQDLSYADFIEKYPFGAMLFMQNNRIDSVLSPFLFMQNNAGQKSLRVHLARTQERDNWPEDFPVTALFQGANGYVSPKLYDSPRNVPTWNYSALQVQARLHRLPITDYAAYFEALIERFDADWLPAYSSVDPAYLKGLEKGLLLFELHIEKVEWVQKWSQNKSEKERMQIARYFMENGNEILGREMWNDCKKE